MIRIYSLFRVLINNSNYASARAVRICRLFGC